MSAPEVKPAEPDVFTGNDNFSQAIDRALISREGVALLEDAFDPLQLAALKPYYTPRHRRLAEITGDQKRDARLAIANLVSDLGIIDDETKLKIINLHLQEIPVAIDTSNIGIANTLTKDGGAEPHVDQTVRLADENVPLWQSPNFYTGVFLSLGILRSSEWNTWATKAGHFVLPTPDREGSVTHIDRSSDEDECIESEPALSFQQDEGTIAIIRHQDVLHKITEHGPTGFRLAALADIGLVLSPDDLTKREITEMNDWAEEKRRRVVTKATFGSLIELEPAEQDGD